MTKKNIDSYNLIVSQWKQFRDQSTINQCIVDMFSLLPKKASVLDVGCGTGYPIAHWLAHQGCRVIGIDASLEMINIAKKMALPQATFIHTDILHYVPQEQFEGIIAFDSLFHLALNDQKHVITKLIQSLSVNGIFLMTHGKKHGEIQGEMFGQPFYYSSLATQEYVTLLQTLGMTILSIQEDYQEKTTGTRDLLLIAKKHTQSASFSIK